ncbi:hypothetical protein JMJ56_16160 [Belnapia sp. T18]|uniref:Uncharacterized protein n=1 Tax=Belnapia arida TaxID=2804533 RepID=A0ABS1U767_9PROT|nr:hypothetical protein [Belnapia arida]MBL6079552.1 hypothetical protein [Belnapia arida]
MESTASGEITPSLRLLGGPTLFDAEITRSGTAAVVGNRPNCVPTYQTNHGLDWDLPWTPGLSLNGAVVLTGRQQVDTAIPSACRPGHASVSVPGTGQRSQGGQHLPRQHPQRDG